MISTRFAIQKLFGVLLLLAGAVGLGYLIWVYAIWGKTLPEFSDSARSIFGEQRVITAQVSSTSFGDLVGFVAQDTDGPSRESLNEPVDSAVGDIQIERVVDNQPSSNSIYGLQDHSSEVALTIPRLDIEDARIQLDVNGSNERIYDTVLTRSVAHLEHSAYPGEFGNTFLFGHSKLPIFAGNDYESIFTNLPKVKVGDIVRVKHTDAVYTYQISQTGVVDPSDTFVMNQPESKKMLTLMTCIPPGFEHQRYITVGELIEIEEI